jgi:hypothetical protein
MMISLLKNFENRGEAKSPLFIFDTYHLSPYISPQIADTECLTCNEIYIFALYQMA